MSNVVDILSVNISEKKGVTKKPVNQIIINNKGIKGDAHSGHWNRQISLLGIESIEKFKIENNCATSYGGFAENITTRGMQLNTSKPLDLFISDELILEVTQIGKKCNGEKCAIFKQSGNCIMPVDGIFCRVVHTGKLEAGNKMIYSPRIYKVSVITVSDRASSGIYEDKSGPEIESIVNSFFKCSGLDVVITRDIVPDNPLMIEKLISSLLPHKPDVIITTGGTGIGPKDNTTDVLKKMIDKEIPGIMEYIRVKYGSENPAAIISRSIAGVKDQTLIYCIPGSTKAVVEYMREINKTLMHSIFTVNGLDIHN